MTKVGGVAVLVLSADQGQAALRTLISGEETVTFTDMGIKVSKEVVRIHIDPETGKVLEDVLDGVQLVIDARHVSKIAKEVAQNSDVIIPVLGMVAGGKGNEKITITKKTGKKDGEPTGEKTKIEGSSNNKEALKKENESAELLAKAGYQIEQNPGTLPNGKNPDYKIEGEYFDCYTPFTNDLDNLRDMISNKVKRAQANKIVLNLDNTIVTPEQVKEILLRKPKKGLQEVIGIKDGKVIQIFP